MDSAGSDMRLYLAYDGYITARQLSLIIGYVDDVHAALSHGEDFRREQLTFPDRARLRVDRVATGNSIELVFQAGQQMAADFLGAGSVIVGGASMVAATTALLVGAFSRIRIERQRAQLGERALESERMKLDVARVEQTLALRRDHLTLILQETLVGVAAQEAALGLRTLDEIAGLAATLARPVSSLDQQLNSGTLIQAALNGQDLVTPKAGEEPQSGA